MNPLPKINLVVMQPAGYVHSLGFLDTARYFRHHFRLLGAQVLISKNRMRADSLNVVFGAHLGFPPEWCERYVMVFVNLEQLGSHGANLSPAYLALLKRYPVIEYAEHNVKAYRSTDKTQQTPVPIIEFLNAPYLEPAAPTPLRDRPIDLLFIGSMNPARREIIRRIESVGLDVGVFDHALYGPERDTYIQQSKAVINMPFYEVGIFEQVRASTVLSQHTPLISLRGQEPPPAFQDVVSWVDDSDLENYFSAHFKSDAWYAEASESLGRWRNRSGAANFGPVADCCAAVWAADQGSRRAGPWVPNVINLGSGRDYKPGWLNLDILARTEPDLLLDLCAPLELPLHRHTTDGIPVVLQAEGCELIYANNVLEHVTDLPALMGNALRLLRDGGVFLIEVPYERALTAWQDPTHVRALNENSWLYYTDWFWYLGWFEHRFDLHKLTWLSTQVQPCDHAQAAFMKVELVKRSTTPNERMTARTMQSDFGGLPEDRP